MKKLLALLLALTLVVGLFACSTTVNINEDDDKEKETTEKADDETTAPTGEATDPAGDATAEATDPSADATVPATDPSADPTTPSGPTIEPDDPGLVVEALTYAGYVAAELDEEVTVMCYVQATQSWWDNKITVYAADEDGAYFIYEMACSEEDAALLTAGAPILVTGYKAAWAGEVEIVDATFIALTEYEGYIAPPKDLTALLGAEEMIDYQNQTAVFTDMTVKEISFKNGGGDDIYVTLTKDGAEYSFCVEVYLTGTDTDVYTTTAALQAGDVVDVGCFLYWYEGMNPHIIDIAVK